MIVAAVIFLDEGIGIRCVEFEDVESANLFLSSLKWSAVIVTGEKLKTWRTP